MKQETLINITEPQKAKQRDPNIVEEAAFVHNVNTCYLAELETQLNQLMSHTNESMLLVDTNLTIITANPKFFENSIRYLGRKINKGTSILASVQPARHELVRRIYENVLKGEKHETEIELQAADGEACYFVNRFKPVYDSEKTIVGVFASTSDITTSKRVEMALRIREEKHHIVEKASDGFVFSEINGDILDVNDTSCNLFGYSQEEFRTLNWKDIVVYDDELKRKFREDMIQSFRVNTEIVGVHKSGKRFLCALSSIIYDDANEQKRISTFVSDISEQRKAEEEVMLREKRFSTLVEHSADGIAILDLVAKPVYVSPAIEKVLGYTVEETKAMDMGLFGATHPDDIQHMMADWETMLANPGVPVPGRLARIKHKDGSWRWIEGVIINMLHEPAIAGIVNNFRDVTTRVQAEQEKEFERRDKEALINSTEDLIWSVSREFRLIAGNRAFIESMRVATGLILVPGDDMLMDGYFDQRYMQFWQTIYTKGLKGETIREEIFVAGSVGMQDGWIELTMNPIFDQGDIIGVACYSRNISEQKQLQESLSESEEKFRAAFKYSAIGMAIVGLDGSFRIVNDSLCHITGYNASELKARTYRDITHPDDIDIEATMMKELMEGKREAYQLEKRYIHKSKDVVWIHLATSLVRHKYGEPQHFVLQIEDITQRKRDELRLLGMNESLNQRAEQLAASNAELEQFAYIASHDLQEPLRMVTSFLTRLEEKYKDKLDERASQYITFAVDGATRMRIIILDLLEYSKIGRTAYELEWVNMNDLVQEVVDKSIWKTQGVQVEWVNLPSIFCARTPLFQVVQNLVSNAIKYRKKDEEPHVMISAKEETNCWHFMVADNGIGIDSRFFEKIFVLFQRLHHKEEYTGSGIGLAICKKIIENHNGRIWVESEYGKGSTFHFTINK